MNIAILGAGAAGLSTLRHCLEQNLECVVFEKSGNVGGMWNYTDNIGVDENGLPEHSSMYRGLTTNIPKELMEFKGFRYEEKGRSFLPQSEVLDYLNTFADHFNLRQHIKFFKHVAEVDLQENEKWKVQVKDLKTGELEWLEFDNVVICTGHYSVPRIPESIPGLEHFKGHYIHSHDYRKPDKYKDKSVLVVGGGSSGIEVSRLLLNSARKVFLSFRSKSRVNINENIVVKPNVTLFENGIAKFEESASENIDEVIFCTGYYYSYPFLTKKCGIRVQDNWVKYLYKHILNIEHPTMAFIGIPFAGFPIPLIEHQVRFVVAFFQKEIHKSLEEMLDDLNTDMRRRKEMGYPLRYAHKLIVEQRAYFQELSLVAGIERMPVVLQKLFEYHNEKKNLQARYKIINDESFIEL